MPAFRLALPSCALLLTLCAPAAWSQTPPPAPQAAPSIVLPAQALPPVAGLPAVEPAAAAEPSAGSIQFIGNATVIVRHAGFTILTDPNFLHLGQRVHLGYGLRSRRLTEPAIALEKLPPIDLVVLSHFHGDHFDQLVQQRLNRSLPIVTTRSAKRQLGKLEFTAVHALATWEAVELVKGDSRLRITAMPARHGPPIVNRALPEVMGSLLEFQTAQRSDGYRLYISGDTTVHDDLREIPRRHPNVDMALLHLGGTRVAGVIVTMDAAQGVEALRIIDPKQAIPIHFNDYTVFKSPLSDFVQAIRQAGLQDKVTYLRHGDIHPFEIATDGSR